MNTLEDFILASDRTRDFVYNLVKSLQLARQSHRAVAMYQIHGVEGKEKWVHYLRGSAEEPKMSDAIIIHPGGFIELSRPFAEQ
jgi:hypothetical protein